MARFSAIALLLLASCLAASSPHSHAASGGAPDGTQRSVHDALQSAHALLAAKLAEVDALLEAGGPASAPVLPAGDAAVSATLSRLDRLAGSLSAGEAARSGGDEAEDAAAVATLRAQLAATQATLLRVRAERTAAAAPAYDSAPQYNDPGATIWTPLGPMPPSLAALLPRPRPRRTPPPPPQPQSRTTLAVRLFVAAFTCVAAAAQAPAVLALARALAGIATDVFAPRNGWARLRAVAPELAAALRAAQHAFDASAPPAAEALAAATRRRLQHCADAAAAAAGAARPAAARVNGLLRAAWLARFAAAARRAAAERREAMARERLFRGWAAFSEAVEDDDNAPRGAGTNDAAASTSGRAATSHGAKADAGKAAADAGKAAADAAAAAAAEEARRERAATEARERYKSWARSETDDEGASIAAAVAAARAAAGAPAGGEPRSPRGEVERLLTLRARPLPREGPARDARFRQALRLRASAAPADVARAFRRLSGRVHPDKCSHPGASDAQAMLSMARDGLLHGFAPPPTPAPGDEDSGSGDDAPSTWEAEPDRDRERPDDGFKL